MIIALDCETYEYDQKEAEYRPVLDARKFVLGCYKTDTGITKFFTDKEEMWNSLMALIESNIKRGKRTFIYGHNIEYDWYSFAHNHLLDENMKYIIFNPFIGIYKEKAYFLDTMAFYRMSLEKVGEMLQFPKMKMPPAVKSLDEIKPYLQRDVEITLMAMQHVKKKINELGFNPRKLLTAGQLAMTSFMTYNRRTKLLYKFTTYNEETRIRHIHKSSYPKKVRQSYRGGNNTAYQIGTFSDCTLIDINGLYGKAMVEMDFPILQTEKYFEGGTVGMLEMYMKEHVGVAQVTVEAPALKIPYLPIRYGGYTMFLGSRKLKGTWTFLELKKAMELGYEIKEVHWSIRYKKAHFNPLKDYILHLYELEKEAKDKSEKSVIKLLRNNLYGKFAQYKKSKDYKIVTRAKSEALIEKGYRVASCVENKYVCEKELNDYEPSYTNPIISSLITAYSRDYLYDELVKLPKEDLLYCDTDSILFRGDHLDKFSIGEELGQFKVEKDENGELLQHRSCKILGEKRYYIHNAVKVSGVPKRYRDKHYLDKEEDIIMDRMYGLKEALQHGDFRNVGKFMKKPVEMKSHAKYMIATPLTIDETHLMEEE